MQETESRSVTFWAQVAKWDEDRRPFSPSYQRIRRRNITLEEGHGLSKLTWSSGRKESTSWTPGDLNKTTSGDSQSSQEQWTDESKKEPRWKNRAKTLHEASIHIKKKGHLHTWQKWARQPGSTWLQKLKKVSEESEVILEQKRLQEEEVWKVLEQHMETWEPAERKIEAIAEKAWQLTQRSDTQGKNLEQDWDSFLRLAKESGRTKDIEEMAKVWKDKKERS